ncbi:MAG: hypothetical protein R2939_17230 [Kofleriaceae bacterium]
MLAQAAESEDMPVAALIEAPEIDLQLWPASDYVDVGRPVTFETVRAAARRRDQLALGYFVHAERDHGRAAVGPAVDATLALTPHDQIVVLAGRTPATPT